MSNYNLIVSILAVIGIVFILGDYPIIVGLLSFGVGLGYPLLSDEKKPENKDDEESIDSTWLIKIDKQKGN